MNEPRMSSWSEMASAISLSYLGRLTEARTTCESGLTRAGRIGERRVAMFLESILAVVLDVLGEEGGERLAKSMLEEATALGLVHHRAEAHLCLAMLASAKGRWDVVYEQGQATLAILEASDGRVNHLRFSPLRAEALVRLERWDEVAAAIEDAADRARVAESEHFGAWAERTRAL